MGVVIDGGFRKEGIAGLLLKDVTGLRIDWISSIFVMAW